MGRQVEMAEQITHQHDHGHTLKHDHDDFGPHEHEFSHRHDHQHPKDGSSNEHGTHEHLDLDGPVFSHREHHYSPDETVLVAESDDAEILVDEDVTNPPADAPPVDTPSTDKSRKSRSIFWGEPSQ